MHASKAVNIGAPYWMREIRGVLRPVVERYLHGEELGARDIVVMRAYLRQWIFADGFIGDEIVDLRADVDRITDQRSLTRWLERAMDAGVDPL